MGFSDFTASSSQVSSPPFQRTPTPFTPLKQSPLTPRRTYMPSDGLFTPPSPPDSPPSQHKFTEIKRKHKPNPAMMSKEDVREKRRKIFLKKLSDAREQSRIQARGGEDEMMRTILVSEQRRWQASLARDAARIPTTIEEETETQLMREEDGTETMDDLADEQERELEEILSVLDIHDNAGSDNLCEGCGEEDSLVLVGKENVCFCCGWAPN
ncbi:hypothetical protein DFH27DRAFT_535858 [Peziza echinospora]|nr:hypothetical protein DFH27DRAFT_535858 [Peziza echinospora]